MSKHKKTGKKQTPKNLGDITINDFANSVSCKNRPRKSTNNVAKVLKQIEVEKAWDEKEVFEGDFDFVEHENEDGTVCYVARKVEPRQRRKTTSSSENVEDRQGKVYPLDIWYLISEYIRPEDVGRFASICKLSYAVVCSAKFWFSIYRRYIRHNKSIACLPKRLQPESMFRLYGLRTSVIRSLFYLYPPLEYRLRRIQQHPEVLKKRRCILMWHKPLKYEKWVYYFKLKEKVDISLSHSAHTERQHLPDLLEMLEDVCANQDEHCKVLEVTCSDFVMLPPILGQTLSTVSLTLSQGLFHEKMQLGFDSGIITSCSKVLDGVCEIILDPVINYRILDWWHPAYPHDYSIHLLNQE